MKKSTPLLHSLIKSLSRSEKRYFSRYAQRHVLGEKNNYLGLFELIAQQGAFDEAELIESMAGEKAAAYFPVAKHQLYHQVLDSLHAYHSNASVMVRISKWLHQGSLLVERGFEAAGARLWGKAKKTALELEQYEWLPAIQKHQNRLISRSELGEVPIAELDQMMEEELGYLDILRTETTYWHLLLKVYRYHSLRGTARDEAENDRLLALMGHPLLENVEQANSFTARLYFFQIWGTYHFIQGDLAEAYANNQRRIALFHDQPRHIRHMPDRYLSAMNNFLVDCLKLDKREEFQESLAFIRELSDDPVIQKVPLLPGKVFRLTYMLELNQHVNSGRFDRGLALIPRVEKGLIRYKKQITEGNNTIFGYLLAYTCFGAGEYSQSLRWLNQLLQQGPAKSLHHIHATARLFSLILHYEMGNYDLLENMIRSTQRYLQHVDEWSELETLFIRAFRRVINAAPGIETREIWQQLRGGLEAFSDDPAQGRMLQQFDFLGWLDAKIEGRRFGSRMGSF